MIDLLGYSWQKHLEATKRMKEFARRAYIGIPGTQYLVRDPARMFGIPSIEDTRMPVETVVTSMHDGKLTAEEFAAQYGRRRDEIPKIKEAYEWGYHNLPAPPSHPGMTLGAYLESFNYARHE